MMIALERNTPTVIVRASKALERAREKRRAQIEEGRTNVFERDKPLAVVRQRGYLPFIAVLFISFIAAGAFVWYENANPVIEESLEGDFIEEAIPMEEPIAAPANPSVAPSNPPAEAHAGDNPPNSPAVTSSSAQDKTVNPPSQPATSP